MMPYLLYHGSCFNEAPAFLRGKLAHLRNDVPEDVELQ